MDALKALLKKTLEMIENGECGGVTPEELEIISSIIHSPVSMGREDAAKFLGISLNKFHELRCTGIIKPPRCRKGFKEKEYFMLDLKEAKKKITH